jgi:hypothetical protein
MLRNLALVIFSFLLISCGEKDSYDPAQDYFTFANTDQFVTRHIARTWFIQVATRRFEPAYDQLEAHLNRHGRARLITPIYGALAANGQDTELAKAMFQEARSSYHSLTIGYIERTLKRVAEAQ